MSVKKRIFPFENLSLVNLPKEKWKEIPGFEGYYEISNYGRVKKIPRETISNAPHGGMYLSKERILKGHVDVKHNTIIDVPIYTLNITLSMEGRRYYFSIARLVYFLFVERFNLKNKKIFISPKDHDGRNVHISNLVKSNMQAVKLASYKEGRAISHLTILSKPITQFDRTGVPIQSFPSMYEAGKMPGFSATNIAEVVSGAGHMYKGFFWKEGIHKRRLKLNMIQRGATREEIHYALMERLGIQKINERNPPAFLNLSTKTMKGERWKDVPGYEGLYKISDYGRVKALQKITEGKQQRWMPEQIQKLSIDWGMDKKGKRKPGAALAVVAKQRKKKMIFVARYVYYLFVKKFKLTDTTLRVYYKDNSPLNIEYKNLMLKHAGWSFVKDKK